MKKLFGLALLAVISQPIAAQPADAASSDKHPCETLKKSCESAGFIKGGHKTKKGLYKDCMQPLMAGQAVEGVTAPADAVAACKAKKADHAKYK